VLEATARYALAFALVGCTGASGDSSDAPSPTVAAAQPSASLATSSSAIVGVPPVVIPRSTRPCGTDPPETGGWVEVPAATYTMGKVTDRARLARHLKKPDDVLTSLVFLDPVVTKVDRFWLGRAEVTVGEYARCVAAAVCTPPATGEDCGGSAADLPINCVSFHQATRYCEAVGARLPTEAEWELAARGREGRLFAWGDEADEAAFGGPGRVPVGSCRVRDTPYGIHDLAGNGREWTSTGSGSTRVSKGMECAYELSCLAFNRFVGQSVDEQQSYLGFRCARSDGPGPPTPAFAGSTSPSAAPSRRTVHWSALLDKFVEAKGPVREDTICFVDVTFDKDGRAVRANAVGVSRTDQPACPPALRPLAEKAARTVRVAAHEASVETTLPVRITVSGPRGD
jgi:formylglycine-generating enzyme required for sulfatase activity